MRQYIKNRSMFAALRQSPSLEGWRCRSVDILFTKHHQYMSMPVPLHVEQIPEPLQVPHSL